MITKLGIISGEILTLLSEVERPLTVMELGNHIKETKEDVLMSLGWLIREGHVHVENREGTYSFYQTKNSLIVRGISHE